VDKLQMITHENIYDLAVVKEGEVRLSGNLWPVTDEFWLKIY
jgi:hypothetical protein